MPNPSPEQYRPVRHPSAWTAADLSGASVPVVSLTEDDLSAMARALAAVAEVPTESITRERFPLDEISPTLDRLREEVLDGRGVVILRGLPVESHEPAELERIASIVQNTQQ